MILLTGFEPFGGHAANPSWGAAVHARTILRGEGLAVEAVELPCVFGAAATALGNALDALEPELVVCIGQAGGRDRVSLERIAINCEDAPIPDNAGNQPVDCQVVADGPAAYFSSLPVKAALLAVTTAGFSAEVSQTAGTYVCNHTFYALMHALASRPGVRGGFVHVPFETGQVPEGSAAPSMPLESMAEAIAVVVRASLAQRPDPKLAAGSTH
ncbi:pyroglutamyl-peptidase I [Arthrobacter sp. KBS0703]|uniref:pyroglutamyl-peptidase I n=1 Tax=Arthrobacter sp. KBS0703 TaxID=1955698 RepID=UPI00098F3CB0|nr:pyroglutamyl-peptidase I [Arthrobacter sp. KBS0703]TSE16302.1 pyroglutamyl-peptidase I [Arthrobacter sp. KBS0703]